MSDPQPGAFAALGVRMGIAEFSARYLAGYVVRLHPVDGLITLGYDDGRGYTPLAHAQPSNLNRGTAVNRVGVVAEGPRVRVLLNGTPALDVVDDRAPWGAITLGAGAGAGASAEAAYRNLVVRRLGGESGAAAP